MHESLKRLPSARRGRVRISRPFVALSIALIVSAAPTHVRALHGLQQDPQRRLPPATETVQNEQKLDAALRLWARSSSGAPSMRVIVTAAPGQVALVKGLVGGVGGRLRGTMPGIHAVAAEVSIRALGGLTANPNVVSVSLDAPLVAIDGYRPGTWTPPPLAGGMDGASDTSPSLRALLGLTPATPGGADVGVAIVDSGIAPSIDFAGRLHAFYDFTADGSPARPTDPYGHGTHVAGMIGSSGATSSHGIYRGLAPHARLVVLRVLDGNGTSETSRVIAAIEFATANRLRLGIQVINLALGHPIYEPAATDPLVRAVERAVDAGIVVVVAAGNYGFNRDSGRSGYAGITSPGNAPSAITVGALSNAATVAREDDEVTAYSSRGPSWYDGLAKPDLLAPGHAITSNGEPTSALYATYPSIRVGASHMRLNGTSMAAAATSGVVALLIEAQRQANVMGRPLTPNTIKAILQYTAAPLGPSASGGGLAPDALMQGAGAIDVPAALAMARAIDASGSLGDDRDVTQGPSVVWDHVIDWAANIVWGPELVGMASGTVDQSFVWGYVDSEATTMWGSLATAPGGGQTFVWGYDDTSTATSGGQACDVARGC